MAVIRRILAATCAAFLLSSVLWIESGLTLPVHQVRFGSFFATSHRRTAQIVRPHPFLHPVRRTRSRPHRQVRPPAHLSAPTTVLAYPPPPLQARAAILVDMRSRKVLVAMNPDERLPIASTTKITTAIVALHHSRLSDPVTVSQNAANVGESTMGLERGERLTVRQLLYGLLLNSGNDAAVALAEHVGGSEARFVQMMNALARALHMRNTHYVTPHGLDTPDHYSSARDLATIALYAMRDPTFRQIVATASYHIPATKHNHEHWLASVNRVLYWYPGVDGVKPGDTDAAGLCQVISVNRDGKQLLAVLLHTRTLVFDIRNLLDYGLRDYRWVQDPYLFDGPTSSLSGGSGGDKWLYYFGAGHYIRGLFLAYFNTHGGLQTLGYPRTEQIVENGELVQYFEGGELIYDAAHHSVYPADLGVSESGLFGVRSVISLPKIPVSSLVTRLYGQLGGKGVFGLPISGLTWEKGYQVQYFQYGELALVNGTPWVVPLGDAALRRKGWLPVAGAADAYPTTMAPAVIAWIAPPPRPVRPPVPIMRILTALKTERRLFASVF